MDDIQHIDDLMTLNGRAFINAAYIVVLKRPADESGMTHYLRKLRSGGDKEWVVHALARSSEAEGIPIELPGLKLQLAKYRRFALSRWLQRILGVSRVQQAVNRLEYSLYEQNEVLALQLSELQRAASLSTPISSLDPVDELLANARRTLGRAERALGETPDALAIIARLTTVVRSSVLAGSFR